MRAGGSHVETLVRDRDAEELFGVNAMDPTSGTAIARAGQEQARALSEQLAALWY
ncbi:MAG TPA: hypothetical protein VGO32_01995 [Candidatus Limnocylindria bacterium]|nr:hypothetical protein [Candidatus Limnocylindria bacterium]